MRPIARKTRWTRMNDHAHTAPMWTEENIVKLIEALGAERGWSVSYASMRATGAGDTVTRLRTGWTLKLRRANQIMATISELWPSDRPWPDHLIARPYVSSHATCDHPQVRVS